MPKLRPLRTPEEIAAVPLDQPVLIDLSEEASPVESKELKPAEKTEPKPEPKPEPEAEESPLQKQLDDMRRANEASRAEAAAERARAEQAVRNVQERDQELTRERGNREQAEYDAVLNAIGHAQAEADTAQRDLEAAMSTGEFKLAAEAQRRLSTATARLVHLEDGKVAFEARREEKPAARAAQQTTQARPSVDAQIDALTQLSGRQRDWLKRHPDAMTDPRKNTRLGAAHLDAVDAGHPEDTDAYYQYIEERLGYRKPPSPEEDEDEPESKPRKRSAPVSAPVSREAPSMSAASRTQRGQVELSADQREAARIAGVDDATYAKGVLELERRKALGMYRNN